MNNLFTLPSLLTSLFYLSTKIEKTSSSSLIRQQWQPFVSFAPTPHITHNTWGRFPCYCLEMLLWFANICFTHKVYRPFEAFWHTEQCNTLLLASHLVSMFFEWSWWKNDSFEVLTSLCKVRNNFKVRTFVHFFNGKKPMCVKF